MEPKTLKIEKKVSVCHYKRNSQPEEYNECFQRDQITSKHAALKCFCHTFKYSGHEKRNNALSLTEQMSKTL